MCNIPLKDINLHAKRFVCRLFSGFGVACFKQYIFLNATFMPISLLRQAQHKNANSYNAGPEETTYETRCENAKHLVIGIGCVTLLG